MREPTRKEPGLEAGSQLATGKQQTAVGSAPRSKDLLFPEAFDSSMAAKLFIPQLEKRPLGDETHDESQHGDINEGHRFLP